MENNASTMETPELRESTKPFRPKCSKDWEDRREIIEQLYWQDDKELPEVMDLMKAIHGFQASKKQYKTKFRQWNIRKNISSQKKNAMLSIQERRRLVTNKETKFLYHGRLVAQYKLDRFEKSASCTNQTGEVDDKAGVQTPSDVEYRTPSPAVAPGPTGPPTDDYAEGSIGPGDDLEINLATIMMNQTFPFSINDESHFANTDTTANGAVGDVQTSTTNWYARQRGPWDSLFLDSDYDYYHNEQVDYDHTQWGNMPTLLDSNYAVRPASTIDPSVLSSEHAMNLFPSDGLSSFNHVLDTKLELETSSRQENILHEVDNTTGRSLSTPLQESTAVADLSIPSQEKSKADGSDSDKAENKKNTTISALEQTASSTSQNSRQLIIADTTESRERRWECNRRAQKAFRKKVREQKEHAERERQNQQHAGNSYSIPKSTEPWAADETCGLPWGSISIRHVMTRGHESESRKGGSGDDWSDGSQETVTGSMLEGLTSMAVQDD
ncbi:hypothetical protein JX266_008110 [Neoarthrinium moseri]|nr:hypothetical protein JX266_008110 [Neoarthrinium moseri]